MAVVSGMVEGSTGKLINGYVWQEEIGRGAWGKVRKVIHAASGEECAVKIMYRHCLARKIRNGLGLFLQEFELVRSLNHPNIIKYRELDFDSNPDKLYLFMELCSGSISNMLPSNSEPKMPFIRDKFRQLLEGLKYLHSLNIAHHDIKTENVLINSHGVVKISDFGVAEKFAPTIGCKIFYGTPAYQAPEIAGNVTGDSYDGTKADIWSAGIVLYEIVTGSLPFQEDSVYLLLKSIENNSVRIPKDLDRNLQDLLRKILAKDPRQRMSAHEVLQHPWLNNAIGHEEIYDKDPTPKCCCVS